MCMGRQKTRIKTICKMKNKVGEMSLPDFKIYTPAVIKTGIKKGTNMQISGAGNLETDSDMPDRSLREMNSNSMEETTFSKNEAWSN